MPSDSENIISDTGEHDEDVVSADAAAGAVDIGTPTDDSDKDGGAQDGDPRNREAAKWRTRFRDAERQITALEGQVAALREAAVHAVIERAGYRPQLLAASQVEPGDLFTADGAPDEAEIVRVIGETAARLGAVRRGKAPNPQQGRGGGAPTATGGWAHAFAPRPLN